MVRFLQKLKLMFHTRSNQLVDEAGIDEILDRGFHQLHDIDPETSQQWLRLQRVTAQRDTETVLIKSRFVPRLALSAAVAVFAMVCVYVYFFIAQPSPEMFATARGQQKEVLLNDGSHVTLNYATELVVPKLQSGQSRRLLLTGEAYFRVQLREDPFIVSTTYADVQVIGTEFNLRAREGALEVAVINGVVKISAVKDGKDSSLLLSRYQMAYCPLDGFPVRIGNIPFPEYPGWMHGKLFLSGTSFQTACREIEMRFDVTIRIDDQRFDNEIVSGVLDARTAESALTALCELTGKRFMHDGQSYHIY
jgi:transmembrane sensor